MLSEARELAEFLDGGGCQQLIDRANQEIARLDKRYKDAADIHRKYLRQLDQTVRRARLLLEEIGVSALV
jgi:hypothetical protein